jgi:putative serine/threonine protein kinase
MLKSEALKISIEQLENEPYASVICYPKPTKIELRKRLKELQKLKVKAIEFSGEKEAFNIPVLGKGCVGIVTIAYVDGKKIALKIRRVDADRAKMQNEADMLKKANSVDVGPRLLDFSKNFILMQYINGNLLPVWLKKTVGAKRVKIVLREILEQCWRLDMVKLDHGELSHAPKHVIVNASDEPFIVDFETASVNRKPSNVTSICQFLFISGLIADKVAEKIGVRDRKGIIEVLRIYKVEKTRKNFEKLLETCKL